MGNCDPGSGGTGPRGFGGAVGLLCLLLDVAGPEGTYCFQTDLLFSCQGYSLEKMSKWFLPPYKRELQFLLVSEYGYPKELRLADAIFTSRDVVQKSIAVRDLSTKPPPHCFSFTRGYFQRLQRVSCFVDVFCCGQS